jgi:hypothetical protein
VLLFVLVSLLIRLTQLGCCFNQILNSICPASKLYAVPVYALNASIGVIIGGYMPSDAWKRFRENAGDIDSLIDFYNGLVSLSAADLKPIPAGADVLFRSAIVLMVSNWEAYIEDIVSEALYHIVNHLEDSSKLPKEIKKIIAGELKNDKNELAVWSLADNGWKHILKTRLKSLKESRDRSFNTPKAHQTEEFIKRSIGIDDIQKAWSFNSLKSADVSKKLDVLIEIRGQIAHRGPIRQKIDKEWVSSQMEFLRNLVSKTGGHINRHVKTVTGVPLWTSKKV